MKRLIEHIATVILILIGMASCVSEFPETGGNGENDYPELGDRTLLVLNIRPLDTRATAQDPIEKVKSLRVIIVNTGNEEQDALIECNRYIYLPTMPASSLGYTLTWPTYAGPKQIFVVANEESVTDLSDELDSFEEGSDPEQLLEWIESYYFEPEYEVESDGSIFLPYTSNYDNLTAVAGQVNNITTYLVPVATKFIFNFINNREHPVNVNGISLSYINHENYLFAHVGERDLNKKFGTESYYWIDWLAKVSEASWEVPGYSDNEEFNGKYGWILDYTVPSEEYFVHTFVDKNTLNNAFPVPGYTLGEDNREISGKESFGPVYLPESINFLDPNVTDDEPSGAADGDDEPEVEPLSPQQYYLTIDLEDTVEGKTPQEFINMMLPNLKALFRNTYVIVNIKMGEGDVEVFAYIADWTRKSANGYVVEGQAPNPNPMGKKKK